MQFDTELSSSSYWDEQVLGLLLRFSNQTRTLFSERVLQIAWLLNGGTWNMLIQFSILNMSNTNTKPQGTLWLVFVTQ